MSYQKNDFRIIKDEKDIKIFVRDLKDRDYYYTIFWNLKHKNLGLHKNYPNIFMITDKHNTTYHNKDVEKIKYFQGDWR